MHKRIKSGGARIYLAGNPPRGSRSENNTKLTGRYLGVTKRVWFILLFVFAVFFFTRSVLHNSHSPSTVRWTNAHLTPVNYFNESYGQSGPDPFGFCPEGADGDTLAAKYGISVLSQTRLHTGSGARIQRLIQRALRGESVTISVVGGSVSACHGAGDDPISPDCYPSRFFRWWNTVLPHPASELTNGAMRQSNSQYFAFCNAHHIPDVTDLVILEFDVDDPPEKETLMTFEILIRSILIRPDAPAVLIVGHFSPQAQQNYGWSGPEHWHTLVATFYDVPHISIKPILYPVYMATPKAINKHFADPMLANPSGHGIIADVLIAYFQTQICKAWDGMASREREREREREEQAMQEQAKDAKAKLDGDPHGLFGGVGERKGVPPEKAAATDEDPDAERKPQAPNPMGLGKGSTSPNSKIAAWSEFRVPSSMMTTRGGDGRRFIEIRPWCMSANDLINPLPPSLFQGSGWSIYHPPPAQNAAVTPSAHYYYSTIPASKLRIPLQIAAGDVAIYYLQESMSDIGHGSSVYCWVDDNYTGAVRLENAGRDIPPGERRETLEMIDRGVARGSHFVECQLLGEEEQGVPSFKIIGIFAT